MDSVEIAALLPAIFQATLRPVEQDGEDAAGNDLIPALPKWKQGDVLGALLQVMEDLHAPSEQILSDLERHFLPERTDDRFLPLLAHWLGLDWMMDERPAPDPKRTRSGTTAIVAPHRMRRLLMRAVSLAEQRGSRAALIEFLEIATGAVGFRVWQDAKRPFHIVVDYPAAADQELVRRIVEWEKPACVTYELCPAAQATQVASGGRP